MGKIVLLVVVMVVVLVGGRSSPNPRPPPTLPAHLDPATCPPTYEEHPLVLISLDGFRVEYLRRGLTPTLQVLRGRGVTAPYMKPSFPTITFPNHYTLVTGMYPAAHGIIANKFYDSSFDAEFRVGRPEFFEKRWWGGEPLWSTVQRQGKKAATFFWPGSEVEDHQPTYWYYYNESVPFTHRVNKVLDWLELPPDTRPSFITLYMHDPDSTGHDHGPNSPQMNAKLMELDGVIGQLVDGLKERGLLQCVNLFIVADHGMADAGQDRLIDLSTYLPGLPERARVWGGGFARFGPTDNSPENKEAMMRALACKRDEMRVYERELLPIRWHMGAQERVEGVVVEVDPGYTVGGDSTFKADEGEHGYDEHFPSMNALFLGFGPDLAKNKEVEAFQNIELYNLMCHLLGVTPAPNNGTWGALHHLLARPPPPPTPTTSPILPPVSRVPESTTERPSQCEGDGQGAGEWVALLKEAQMEEADILEFHTPWGTPQGHSKDTVLLLQPDSVTGYSPRVRLPLWTSFGVRRVKEAPGEAGEWRSDPRLLPEDAPSCPSYRTVKGLNVTRHPLFPPEFSCRDCHELPYLMSNAVPLTDQVALRWRELLAFVGRWALLLGPLNVVAGPVMDYNADTIVDDLGELGRSGELVVPSHIFLVVSRCVAPVPSLSQCPHDKLDAEAFVFPQFIPVTNCLESARFLQEYSAKVGDVEGITGLQFFPKLDYYQHVRLKTRMHSNAWGHERYANRLLDNFLHP
ncbi:venom phosphodiesterase-like isoform X2 [Portunus trituberculatus]|uniref:venom phosphodiesterase-like isoform X2 n=1 Tax=Portunus trituberculatus TaxID=210409 RepID=UPI001E1CD390|nr:venom phosphodiesterase-like isoform X2 [Portunus trituberculatus]